MKYSMVSVGLLIICTTLAFGETVKTGSPLQPRIDLTLILDSSSAVGGQRNFISLQKFALRLVSKFIISPSTTRVSVILCSSNPLLAFGLDKFVNRECTLKAMENIRSSSETSCQLGLSLKLAYRLFLQSKKQRALIHRPRTMIVILNASPQDKRSKVIAKTLRNSGAEIFLTTVGHPVSETKLRTLISKPIDEHYLFVKYPKELDKHLDFIKNRGINQACYNKGIVYDECDRRCRCSKGRMVDCYRVRKDFQSMTLKERRLYIDVLKTVSTVQPYKRIYDELTSYHPKWFEEVHQFKYFFPWHRWYILKFENFLRQIDCRVTVPYWDWIRAVSDDRLWRNAHYFDIWYPGPHGLGGNGEGPDQCVSDGPFGKGQWAPSKQVNTSCLTREFNDCWGKRLPKNKDRDTMLRFPFDEFEDFERDIREWVHDNFHNAIGGVMSLDYSANAPEFWFHHAFLDKLWADWQKRGHKFKHQYYHSVKDTLPGTKVNGITYVDLSKQPMCVKVEYEPTKELHFPDNQWNHKIKYPAALVNECDDDEDD